MSIRHRLVATDLDGTLLRSDGSLSRRTRAVLSRLEEAGIPVVLVTARPMRWLEDLRHVVGTHALAVVSNGAVVMDLRTGEPLEVTGIEPGPGLEMVADIRAVLPHARFAVETVAGLVRDQGYVEPDPVPDDSPVGPLEQVWTAPAVKLLVRLPGAPGDGPIPGPEAARFRELVTAAVGERAVATWTVPGLMEIGPAGVTKATTLARVAAESGIGAAEVIAFGDMPNDLPMLRWAGHGCAVANAHRDVREAADEVVPSNDADGVARTLERLLE